MNKKPRFQATHCIIKTTFWDKIKKKCVLILKGARGDVPFTSTPLK